MKSIFNASLSVALAVLAGNGMAQNARQTSAPGVATPEASVVLSVPIEGVLRKLEVREGTRVAKGQVLAQLDDTLARAAVDAARFAAKNRTAIDHARADLDFAKQKLERLEKVGKSIPAMILEEARAKQMQADAALQSAIAAQHQAELNLRVELARLERCTIRAPFAGVVTRVFANPGATLTTSRELIQLVSLDTLHVDMHLPLSQFGKLHTGKIYRLEAGAPAKRRLEGRLVFIDPMLDAATRTLRCRFLIDNKTLGLPAGFSLRMVAQKTERSKPGR